MTNILPTIWRNLPLSKNVQLFLMRLFQDQFLIGVTGVIFDDDDNILVLRHTYRDPPWSLPGGYLKAGEHPREGLAREIAEESGFLITTGSRIRIRTDHESPRLDICYLGFYEGGSFKPSEETSDYGFFPLTNLPPVTLEQIILMEKAFKTLHPSFPLYPPKPAPYPTSLLARFRNYLIH